MLPADLITLTPYELCYIEALACVLLFPLLLHRMISHAFAACVNDACSARLEQVVMAAAKVWSLIRMR